MSQHVIAGIVGSLVLLVGSPASAARQGRPAGGRVVAVLDQIARTLRQTRYQAKTIVNPRRGIYRFDCSGMTAWVLSRSAPRALGVIALRRPRARDFARKIAAAPLRASRGWQRVARVADAVPGDVFAWERVPGRVPPEFLAALAERHLRDRRYVTGHVGFVIAAPRRTPQGWLVRVADSTSIPHQDDTRAQSGRTGFGMGTLLWLEDEHGAPAGVGWGGTSSSWIRRMPLVIGRALR